MDILDEHLDYFFVLVNMSYLKNQIQKKIGYDSENRFSCDVSIRRNLCLRLQKVDKGDQTTH